MPRCILTADIGGTNPRLAMVEVRGPQDFMVLHKGNVNKEDTSLVPSMNAFLASCAQQGWTTDTCCISVAGPVQNNKCRLLANARFPVDDDEIRAGTLLKHVLVINDFAAIGEAVATIDVSDARIVKQLPAQDGTLAKPSAQGGRAVIGAGTGLGVAYLPRMGSGDFTVVSSEGGHAHAPFLHQYGMIAEHVRKKLSVDAIDAESLVSGQGIRHIANFFLAHPNAYRQIVEEHHHLYADEHFKDSKNVPDNVLQEALVAETNGDTTIDAAAVVASHVNNNKLAHVTMRIFSAFFGAAAQDVASHGLATGGVFLAGGIAAKNVPLLLHGDFMHAFLDNQRESHRALLRTIPVYVIIDYDITFVGCARAAMRAFSPTSSQ